MNTKALTFFGVGVADADMEILSEITPRILKLERLEFADCLCGFPRARNASPAAR